MYGSLSEVVILGATSSSALSSLHETIIRNASKRWLNRWHSCRAYSVHRHVEGAQLFKGGKSIDDRVADSCHQLAIADIDLFRQMGTWIQA